MFHQMVGDGEGFLLEHINLHTSDPTRHLPECACRSARAQVDLELLFPPDDPEAASECSQTFASDAYGLRRWARQDSQDAGAAEEGLEGEGLGGLGQPAVVDVGANVGCWSIFAAKVMKAQAWWAGDLSGAP